MPRRFVREEDEYILNREGVIHNIVTHRHEQDVYVKVQRLHYKKGEFYLTHLDMDRLILEKNYTGNTIKVLTKLKLKMGFNNKVEMFTQQELANELGTTQANVSRALKVLIDDRIIYKVNHNYVFNDKYIKTAGDGNKSKKTDGNKNKKTKS